MSGRSASELLGEYALVLRGIGLTEVAIARLHGAPEPADGESIERVLARRLEQAPSEEQLFARLGKTIVDSERGIDAPATYWNSAPEVHLNELLAPYGCEVSFEPTRRADSLADGQFNVHVTDAAGTNRRQHGRRFRADRDAYGRWPRRRRPLFSCDPTRPSLISVAVRPKPPSVLATVRADGVGHGSAFAATDPRR
jgi:hypothetical protein